MHIFVLIPANQAVITLQCFSSSYFFSVFDWLYFWGHFVIVTLRSQMSTSQGNNCVQRWLNLCYISLLSSYILWQLVFVWNDTVAWENLFYLFQFQIMTKNVDIVGWYCLCIGSNQQISSLQGTQTSSYFLVFLLIAIWSDRSFQDTRHLYQSRAQGRRHSAARWRITHASFLKLLGVSHDPSMIQPKMDNMSWPWI